MRHSFRLACVLALALTSSGASAADMPQPDAAVSLFDAYLAFGLGYGWASYDGAGVPGGSAENNGVSLRGRGSLEATTPGGFGAQLDGILHYEANRFSFAAAEVDTPSTTATLATHVFWRDPARGLIGAIGQYSATRTEWDAAPTFSLNDKNYFAGLEGQYFLGPITLYGQAAYHAKSLATGIGDTSVDGEGVILTAQARYFLTPDWFVAAKGSFDTIRYDAYNGNRERMWQAGLRSEYRLAALPVSLFGEISYGQDDYKNTPGTFDVTEKDTRAMIGVSYSFGARTLQERDRAGASLDPFEPHLTMP